MEKKVAIIQSNYIPWKGYFDMINMADEFILLDDVQFTRRDWRNRNYIKTQTGLQFLTIPVKVKGNFNSPINQIEVAEPAWGKAHWALISQNYSQAAYFEEYGPILKPLFFSPEATFLSQINYNFIKTICTVLDIDTKITWSTDYKLEGSKTIKLLSLCKSASATSYLSGPAAKNYLDESLFEQEGICVEWMDYSGYKEYNQLYPPFQHQVTVLDLIFNMGPESKKFLKSITA